MKLTKRPKRTKVFHRKIVAEHDISQYNCPSCKVYFGSDGPARRVTRFICDCGQELIAEHEKTT